MNPDLRPILMAVRRAAARKGMSMADIAREMGMEASQFRKFMTGKRGLPAMNWFQLYLVLGGEPLKAKVIECIVSAIDEC